MASTSKAFNKCVDPCPRYLRWHTQSLRLLFGQGARTRCPWGENLCATSSTFAGRRHMIGKVVTGCVAILSYHTATQDRGSECRDFGFISRIVTALVCVYIYIYISTHSFFTFNYQMVIPKITWHTIGEQLYTLPWGSQNLHYQTWAKSSNLNRISHRWVQNNFTL